MDIHSKGLANYCAWVGVASAGHLCERIIKVVSAP